jgi:MinD-like ATPase involved in chromosome partitioning or flagellar assembly
MQISVWSNMHGQAATSATTAALASALAQKTAYKVLVAHNHIERSALESYLFRQPADVDKSIHNISNQGMDALVRLYKNGRLKPDMVADYTYSLLKDHRLDILAGTTKKEKTTAGDRDVIINIINCAKGFYDLVVMDTHSGLNENNSLKILETSDFIIFCINQNLFLLEDLSKFLSKYPFLKQKRSAYVISRYEKNGLLSRGNIARKYGISKASIFELPNSANFMEALNKGRVFEYIAFYQNAKACEDKALTDSVNSLCDFIIEGCSKLA